MMGELKELTIAEVGAQGDGVAMTPEGPVYVPYVLPGERVQAEVKGERGRLIAVLEPSASRVAPICRHFAHCGGCALQHMERGAYLAWKRELVVSAFSSRGIEAPVGYVASVGIGAVDDRLARHDGAHAAAAGWCRRCWCRGPQ